MQPTNDVLNAFQLLADTVRDLYTRRQQCLGAKLKIELRNRTYLTFSEQKLGFFKFGDFLRAAEIAGFIKVTPTPGGDLRVWPLGVPSPQPTPSVAAIPVMSSTPPSAVQGIWSASPEFVPVRVRQDLWNAFNSFFAVWAYDRVNDIAYRMPEHSDGTDSTKSVDPGVIQIPPGRARVVGWMRSFATTQEVDVRSQLLSTLEGDSAPYHFNKFVSADQKLHRAWRRFHIQQVVAAIEAWATSSNVRPKDVTVPYDRTRRAYAPIRQQLELPISVAAPSVVPQISPPTPSSALAPRLAGLIDELIDELLRLRGALQIVDPKR